MPPTVRDERRSHDVELAEDVGPTDTGQETATQEQPLRFAGGPLPHPSDTWRDERPPSASELAFGPDRKGAQESEQMQQAPSASGALARVNVGSLQSIVASRIVLATESYADAVQKTELRRSMKKPDAGCGISSSRSSLADCRS
jgi:hypothetical protein